MTTGLTITDNHGETADRYTVIIDDELFTMSIDARSPQGVNIYAGNIVTDLGWDSLSDYLSNKADEVISLSQVPDEVYKAIAERMSQLDNA